MDIDASVSQIMTTDVITVEPDTPVSDVARTLWTHGIQSVPVVEEGRVIGIVTDYDLISQEIEFQVPLYVPFLDAYFRIPGTGDEEELRRILATTARELMSSPAVTVSPDATIQDVVTLMYERRINAVPVVDADGRLVGIVSRADILRLMASEAAEEGSAGGRTDRGPAA